MDQALTAFLVTVAIVGGILSPFILIYVLGLFGKTLEAITLGLQGWVEDVKKRPPFDDVEVNVNPATNTMTVRMLKYGKIVWQGASSRNRLEEDGTLEFKSVEVEE